MEGIKLWLRGLTGFIFMPESSMKKTVKMLLGVIMSILIIAPFIGGSAENVDIFAGADEYINYSDCTQKMEELTARQSRNLYISSAQEMIKTLAGEDTKAEVIITEENEIEKIIVHKKDGALQLEIAAALGVAPSKIQMTE